MQALAVRVDQRGTYSLELVTYGFGCPASESFDITVGKYSGRRRHRHSIGSACMVECSGVRLAEEWRGAEVKGV